MIRMRQRQSGASPVPPPPRRRWCCTQSLIATVRHSLPAFFNLARFVQVLAAVLCAGLAIVCQHGQSRRLSRL